MTKSVICAQIGPRDHYAFPRAFNHGQALHSLITDYWHPTELRVFDQLGNHISGRRSDDLNGVSIHSCNLRTLAAESRYRIQGWSRWRRIIHRNNQFQKYASRIVGSVTRKNPPTAFFAYSYAALEPARAAKSAGASFILSQIDPGPIEYEIIEALKSTWPAYRQGPTAPPPGYFDAWRKEINLSDKIIVNSSWSRDGLLREGVQANRIAQVPIPYQPAQPPPQRPDAPHAFTVNRPLRLLFLGQVNLRKGIADLLEAMSELTREPIELRVVGEKQVQIPQDKLALSNVRWTDFIPRRLAPRLFSESDLFILPTHSDGFGLTQLEAMAHGLPVIASRNCAKVVDHGINGWILDQVNPRTIEEVLRSVLQTPKLLSNWSSSAQVPTDYSLKRVSETLMDLAEGGVFSLP